jgi:poly(3-hydroxybutyrate) depolymerase
MAVSSSGLLVPCLLVLLLAVAIAEEVNTTSNNNLNGWCNGDGPGSISSALEYLDIAETQVPQFCVTGGGRSRCYYVLIPEVATGKVPLAFDIHGTGSCPVFSVSYTGWFQLAQEKKFVAVWPLGVTDAAVVDASCFALPGGAVIGDVKAVDCCCTRGGPFDFVDPSTTNDAEFLRMAIEEVIDTIVSPATEGTVGLSIDTKKVFMAGHSNGCIAALSMGALYSDVVTAVACHAGKLITPFAGDYVSVPTFIVHGLKVGVLPYDVVLVSESKGLASTPDQFRAIADRNRCTQVVPTEQLPNGEGTVETWTACRINADVTLVTLNKAGHTPFLGQDNQDLNPGAVPTTIDTTALVWEFFSKIGTVAETVNPTTSVPSSMTTTSPTNTPTSTPTITLTTSPTKAPTVTPTKSPTMPPTAAPEKTCLFVHDRFHRHAHASHGQGGY